MEQIQQINIALADLTKLRNSQTDFKRVACEETEGGDYTYRTEVYDLNNGQFIKIVFESDSYAENWHIVSLSIVKPKVVEVTNYEVI